MLATAPHCVNVNGFALPPLKRKRSDSSDSAIARNAPVATKLRTEDAPSKQIPMQERLSQPKEVSNAPMESPNGRPPERAQHLPPSLPNEGQSDPSSPSRDTQKGATSKVDVDRLREALEAQLSLEVLLKHNELRLIDQEIAKCQVALEQLRRCAEIPYPGSQTTGPKQSVSAGTGISVWAPGNGPAPLSPAPWGVTDGPYTRHYSRWLLPDPRFDGGEVEPATPMAFGLATPMEGRSTRGNPIDTGYLAGKTTRPQRGSAGAKLQSLPSGYPAPKEKAGPMIIRRKSDGVFVKLVCLDCRRDNFSSTQGFINHCRIAHNRNFASHDAAAVASGEPVEVDEAGAVVGGKNESSSSSSGNAPGFVHPLVRSAHAIESTPRTLSVSTDDATRRSSHSRSLSRVETPTLPYTPGPKTPAVKASNDTFTASEDTPHLSSLMKLRGVGLDLGRLVGEAKTAVDLDGYFSEEGESESEPTSPSADAKSSKPLAAGRQPMRTTASQTASERPDGHKGFEKPSRNKPFALATVTPVRPSVPYQSPYAPSDPQINGMGDVDGADLSPNTVDSNQAPSLVSDDLEATSDSDSPGPSSSEAEDEEDGFRLIDVGDEEDTTGSTTTSHSEPKLGNGKIRNKGQYLPSSVAPLSRKDEKRVSGATMNPNPSSISLREFRTILAHYEETVKRVALGKLIAKSQKKTKKASAAAAKDGTEGVKSLTTTELKGYDARVRDYWNLDVWRYDLLPKAIARRLAGDEGEAAAYLSKDEVVKLMEWKLKHGVDRPTLMGMVRSNPEKVVRSATIAALSSLTDNDKTPVTDADRFELVRESLEKLTSPLRGVGPATASLLLSVARPADVPFYSDDVFLWLCVGVYPRDGNGAESGSEGREEGETEEKRKGSKDNKKKEEKVVKPNGELNVKYNVSEYRKLWAAVADLRRRLNGKADNTEEVDGVTCADVERVAFVIRHLDQSGLLGPVGGETGENEDKGESEDRGRRKRRKIHSE
ncbi:hypothetical protein BJX61DRAFT_530628 [Aspergillus egyptiacus]|nr:hypothetical protein BJX61DRAFT_530628 [Aspergillus egyptiacus]